LIVSSRLAITGSGSAPWAFSVTSKLVSFKAVAPLNPPKPTLCFFFVFFEVECDEIEKMSDGEMTFVSRQGVSRCRHPGYRGLSDAAREVCLVCRENVTSVPNSKPGPRRDVVVGRNDENEMGEVVIVRNETRKMTTSRCRPRSYPAKTLPPNPPAAAREEDAHAPPRFALSFPIGGRTKSRAAPMARATRAAAAFLSAKSEQRTRSRSADAGFGRSPDYFGVG
jgi:hypothetical protein